MLNLATAKKCHFQVKLWHAKIKFEYFVQCLKTCKYPAILNIFSKYDRLYPQGFTQLEVGKEKKSDDRKQLEEEKNEKKEEKKANNRLLREKKTNQKLEEENAEKEKKGKREHLEDEKANQRQAIAGQS